MSIFRNSTGSIKQVRFVNFFHSSLTDVINSENEQSCIIIHDCISPTEFKKTLEEAIRSDTSGHFQRLLISLSQVLPRRAFGDLGACVC